MSIQSRAVSGQHAEIIEHEGRLSVRDNRSTNGTYVNGTRVHESIGLKDGDIIQFGDTVFRLVCEDAKATTGTAKTDANDQALAMALFDRLMNDNSIEPHYQPIVDLRTPTEIAVGFEVLARSSVYGLESAGKMFEAANRLNMAKELSSMLRWKGVENSLAVEPPPHLFINTDESELDSEFVDSLKKLRELNGSQPLTLEIHQNAAADVDAIKEFNTLLEELNVTLAYDHFGVGRDWLLELAECPPNFLKFDLSLIRGIDIAPLDQIRVVEGLVSVAHGLHVQTVAVGIETEGEAATCRNIGFDLGQGYFFGRPTPLHKMDLLTTTGESVDAG